MKLLKKISYMALLCLILSGCAKDQVTPQQFTDLTFQFTDGEKINEFAQIFDENNTENLYDTDLTSAVNLIEAVLNSKYANSENENHEVHFKTFKLDAYGWDSETISPSKMMALYTKMIAIFDNPENFELPSHILAIDLSMVNEENSEDNLSTKIELLVAGTYPEKAIFLSNCSFTKSWFGILKAGQCVPGCLPVNNTNGKDAAERIQERINSTICNGVPQGGAYYTNLEFKFFTGFNDWSNPPKMYWDKNDVNGICYDLLVGCFPPNVVSYYYSHAASLITQNKPPGKDFLFVNVEGVEDIGPVIGKWPGHHEMVAVYGTPVWNPMD